MKTEIFDVSSGNGEFKECPNGHYYQGATCPHCRGNNQQQMERTIQDYPELATTKLATIASPSNKGTEFGDDVDFTKGAPIVGQVRFSRKLVGWLVSYSDDPLGVDYKLFEGRNIIGRDMDCNISVSDGRVSSKHAVLLYRAGKYSITDTQSSHGTFVNGEDIELEPRYINDGDVIRVGNAIFKFRTSL